MKKSTLITLFTAAILFFGSYQVGWGQLLVEDFNYTVGSVLTSTTTADPITGWLAHSGNGTQNIDVTNGLSFAGYAGSGIGGAANVDNNGQDINKPFLPQTSGTVYAAFVIQTQSTNSSGYFLSFGPATMTTILTNRVWVNATGNQVGIGTSASTPITVGVPTLLVLKYDFAAGLSSLFVLNSFSATEPTTANATYSETVTTIGTIGMRQFNAAQKIIVDGIRIGTTWATACTAQGGNPIVATPTFSAIPGNVISTQTVSISTTTSGATIYYTTDGSDPTNIPSLLYSTPISVSSTTTIKAKAYAGGYDPSSIATAIYTFPTLVSNVAALRSASITGFYKLTGEAVLTYQSTAGKVKYIQDASGAIVIYDGSAIITTSYAVGDGIKNIYCTLSLFNGMLELIPYSDPGTAFSTGNIVTPVVTTLASLTVNDQAKLVKVINTTITGTGNFLYATNGTNYPLTDPSGSGLMRTAYSDLNYLNTAIPAVAQDMTGVILVNTSYSATIPLLIPRSSADFTNYIPATAALFATPALKSGLNYVFGNGPSVSQSFDLTGSNLTGAPGNLTVDAGTSNYEVSSNNINFGATASIAFSSATLSATPVYLRLKAGLAIGNYNGELIGVTGGGVITAVNVTCSGTVLAPEPTNPAANFSASSSNYSSIISNWTDNDGTQPATGFLILANTTGTFIDPIDGNDPADDALLSDGSGSVHVLHGVQTYTWTNLDAVTPYFFKIYSYTNSGTDINYKTMPAPSATISTQAYALPLAAWTFDATSAAPNTPTSVAANIGTQSATAMLYADGTNGSSGWLQATELNAFGGTTTNDPRQGAAIFAGMSYCPVGGTANSSNGKSMILKFSMTNFQNPILTFATRGTSTGFTTHQWAWSTDNIVYTDFGTNTANVTTSFILRTLDLSSINEVDQAANVYLRVTFTGAANASGNNRLDNIVINATASVPATKTLNLTAYLEGLYNTGTGKMNQAQKSGAPQFADGIADQVTVELHNATAPFATAYTYSSIDLNINGTVSISTIPAEVSGSYFVVLKHRNSIELWSATAVSFTGSTIDYNFSTSASQAYGSAMKDLGSGVFGMYAGDVNQDGIVDSGDMVVVDNDAANFVAGYVANDVNGDGTINAADLLLLNGNATGFVGKKMP